MSEELIEQTPLLIEWTRDLAAAARLLTPSEVRYLVDAYYQIQDYRVSAANQQRQQSEGEEPNRVVGFLFSELAKLEGRIKKALDVYTEEGTVACWLRSVYGIGPVIAAGLLSHIDITKAPTAGHIWRFAGLDPTLTWGKGEKRPFNARLKVICWKAGQSFMKFSTRDACYYGRIYRERKEYEQKRNDSGGNAATAADILSKKKFDKATEAYKHLSAGKLPPAQIDARARRYAVKLFLAHLHEVWFEAHYGQKPPKPYAIAILQHADYIPPPQ